MKLTKLHQVLVLVFALTFMAGIQTQAQSKKETPFNIITYNIRMNTAADKENRNNFV